MSKNFQAGRLKHHLKFWKTLTSDKNILKEIRSVSIEFTSEPKQIEWPKPYVLPPEKLNALQVQLQKMLNKGVIERTTPDQVLHLSNIFTRDKANGSLRIILDLSDLNDAVVYIDTSRWIGFKQRSIS